MPPTTTLWPLAWHTEAKHGMLRRYLEAWLPIVSHVPGRERWLVDGFAGPGQYIGGANGSPTWMLDVYIGHRQRNDIDSRNQMHFVFIEKDRDRKEHLAQRPGPGCSDPRSPANRSVYPIAVRPGWRRPPGLAPFA